MKELVVTQEMRDRHFKATGYMVHDGAILKWYKEQITKKESK